MPHLTTFVAILFIMLSAPLVFLGLRAMGRETRTFQFFRNFYTEAGALGIPGSLLLALAAYLMIPWSQAVTVALVAAISFGLCGLTWLAGTKLGYWIDNHQWPGKNYYPQDRN